MINLINSSGQQLSIAIRSLTPIKYDPIKIENKLLDGSVHVQTIGTPARFITFDILATHEQVGRLNYAEAIAAQVVLSDDDITYTGILNDISEDRITPRYSDKGKILYIINGVRLDITEGGLI